MDEDRRERIASDSVSGATEAPAVEIQPIELERFDNYMLLALIGHGGMAEIYLALHEGQNRFRKLVVIKRMRAGMRADPFVVQMFLDEARLAARFNHPHVVQTHEIGEIHGEHFLAMEYLDGQPLSKVLRRLADKGITLPLPLAARIVSDALDGLHYAHELADYDGTPLRLVHRDISPHNIFVTHDGVVKLLDFGIAKSDIQESQTRTGLIKGKFAYIAPEQARAEFYDRRADLWSMGVTLWELAAGRRLFKGPNEVATLQAALTAPVPRLDEHRAGVPEPIQRVVDHALQREPDMRIGTALEMKEILEEWLGTQGTAGSRASLRDLMKEAFGAEMHTRRTMIRELVGRIPKDSTGQTGRFSALSVSAIVGLASSDGTPSAVRPVEEGATKVSGSRRGTSSSESMLSALDAPALASAETAPADASNRRAIYAVVAGIVTFLVVGIAVITTTLTNQPAQPDTLPTTTGGAVAVTPPTTSTPTPPPTTTTPPVAVPGTTSVPTTTEPPATTAEVEPSGPTKVRPGGRRPTPRGPVGQTSMSTDPTPEIAPQPPPTTTPEPVQATGRLQLDAAPYAVVFLGSRRLGITPIDVELPAGSHTLILRNPEQGIETTYRVTIGADQVVSRRVALE